MARFCWTNQSQTTDCTARLLTPKVTCPLAMWAYSPPKEPPSLLVIWTVTCNMWTCDPSSPLPFQNSLQLLTSISQQASSTQFRPLLPLLTPDPIPLHLVGHLFLPIHNYHHLYQLVHQRVKIQTSVVKLHLKLQGTRCWLFSADMNPGLSKIIFECNHYCDSVNSIFCTLLNRKLRPGLFLIERPRITWLGGEVGVGGYSMWEL